MQDNPIRSRLEVVRRFPVPFLWQHFRGSSCAVPFRDELWFTVHFKYQARNMHYVHAIAVLNAETLEPLRYTTPFHFERSSDVEYCLGMVIEESPYQVLLTYSSRDAEPKAMRVPIDTLTWISCQ